MTALHPGWCLAVLGRLAAGPVLALLALAQIFIAALAQAESPPVIGNWKVDIAFANGESRSVQFDAREGGRGSFRLLGPQAKVWDASKPSEAKWTEGGGSAVTFSGPVEFRLGNIGLLRGTLVLMGTRGSEGSIAGEARFFPAEQDPKDPASKPSKSGTFQAARVADRL